jgi:hypothetical protein
MHFVVEHLTDLHESFLHVEGEEFDEEGDGRGDSAAS